VAPGADDNASGVAGLLAIARALAAYQLAHPVRFAAITGEEVDFQGARAFIKRAAETGMSYAGAFNLDAIGSAVRSHEIYLNGDEDSAWLMQVLARVNDRAGLGEEIVMRQNPEIVADDNIFREAGIHAVLVTRSIYGQSAVHHTAEDVLDNVDLHGVLDCAAVVLIGLGALVEIT
jgi:Zn-dependent M28 family amino/carboxypeptidase